VAEDEQVAHEGSQGAHTDTEPAVLSKVPVGHWATQEAPERMVDGLQVTQVELVPTQVAHDPAQAEHTAPLAKVPLGHGWTHWLPYSK